MNAFYLPHSSPYVAAVAYYGQIGKCNSCKEYVLFTEEEILNHLKKCDSATYQHFAKRSEEAKLDTSPTVRFVNRF